MRKPKLGEHTVCILTHLAGGKIIARIEGRGPYCEDMGEDGLHFHYVWQGPFNTMLRHGLIERFGTYPRGDDLYRLTAKGREILAAVEA